jgi:hypothetical protein
MHNLCALIVLVGNRDSIILNENAIPLAVLFGHTRGPQKLDCCSIGAVFIVTQVREESVFPAGGGQASMMLWDPLPGSTL